MKHLVDPKNGNTAAKSVWHADPKMETLVLDIVEKVAPARFVETGTNMGWTVHWMAKWFPNLWIHTVENDEEYYRLARENMEEVDSFRIQRTLGDSREFLRSHLLDDGLSFFWLDAHFWDDHPLEEECRIVSQLPRYVVLVDDFHCGEDFPGDPKSPAMVTSLGSKYWRPNYSYQHGYSGYALFLKGVDYVPPATMSKHESRV